MEWDDFDAQTFDALAGFDSRGTGEGLTRLAAQVDGSLRDGADALAFERMDLLTLARCARTVGALLAPTQQQLDDLAALIAGRMTEALKRSRSQNLTAEQLRHEVHGVAHTVMLYLAGSGGPTDDDLLERANAGRDA